MNTQHLFVSSACYHTDHQACRRLCGVCGAPCLCPCHGLTGGLDHKLDLLLTKLDAMKRQESIEMAKIQDVQAKQAELLASVQSETTLVQSVKTLLEGQNAMIASLKQQLQDAINNGNDPVALQAVVDGLTAILSTNEVNKQATADAVVANTPPANPA